MTSIYGGKGGSGGGSIYRRSGSHPKTVTPTDAQLRKAGMSKGRSFGGGVLNAVHTIEKSVSGAPEFYTKAYRAAAHDVRKHPESLISGPFAPWVAAAEDRKHSHLVRDVVTPFTKDEAYRWGPLFHLHPHLKEWAIRNYETGFVPAVLDVLAVTSFATKGAVASGALKTAPRSVELKLPSGKTVERPVVGSELSRRGRIAVQHGLNKLPPDRHLGEHLRATKWDKRAAKRENLNLQARLSPYEQTAARLSKNETIANSLLADYVTKPRILRHLADLHRLGTPDAIAQAKLFGSEKIMKLIDNPSAKMLREEAAAQKYVYPLRDEILPLESTTKLERQYRALLLQEGATVKGVPLDASLGEKLLGKPVKLGDRQGRLTKLDGDQATVTFGAKSKAGKSYTYTKEVPLDELTSTEVKLTPPPGKTIPEMIDKLRAELPKEPRYLPERMVNEKGQTWQGVGGLAQPKLPSALKQNKSTLRVTGKIARHFDTLGPNTLRVLAWAAKKDIHARMLDAATPYESQPIGRGWEFVKGTGKGPLGHIEANNPEFLRQLEDMTPEKLDHIVNLEDPGLSGLGHDMTTLNEAEAATDAAGRRLVIPTSVAKKYVGEYTRNNSVIARIARSITQVWRALVLNLRLPWLENNIIGNTFMYVMKTLGIGKKGAMDQETFLRYFGDQSRLATFFHTQSPTAGIVARALNSRRSPTFWTREWDKAYETVLRKGATEKYLGATPEVGALAREMPLTKIHVRSVIKDMKQRKRDWGQIKKTALERNPQLASRVSQQVNDALGDFTNLSDAEQRYLRGVMPFYGWFRAITVVLAKMPIDTPGRAVLLASAGRIGQDWTDDWWRRHGVDPEKLPWYQRAGIPMGDKWFFKTGGIWPYATLAQIMSGDVADLFNPLLSGPLLEAAKLDFNKAGWGASAKAVAKGEFDVARFLPESQLLFPYNSKSGGPHGRGGAFYRYFGPSIFSPNFGYLANRP